MIPARGKLKQENKENDASMHLFKWLLGSWANFKEVCRIEVGHKIHMYFSQMHSFICM